MAQDAVEMIMRGVLAGGLAKKQKEEQTRAEQKAMQEQERIDNEVEARKAQTKFHQQEVDNALKHQNAMYDLAKQAADIQAQVHKQSIAQHFIQGGELPGDVQTPVGSGTGGASFSPANPAAATSIQHSIPLDHGGSMNFTTPTREAAATTQANLKRILDQPDIEAKIKESLALQGERANQAEESKKADFQRAFMMKAWDDNRNNERIKAEGEWHKLQAQTQLQVANIQASSRNNGIPEDFDYSGYLQRGLAGDVNAEEVQRLGKPGLVLKNAMSKAGGKFLTKEEQDVVGEFKMMVDSVGLMDQVIANQPQGNTWGVSQIRGLLNSGNTAVTTPEAELQGRLSVIARGLMKERGALSNRDIERASSLMPSRFQPVQANIQKRNDLVRQISSVVDAKLSTLPPAQRKIIVDRVGLNKLQMLGGQPAPAAAPVQGQPQQAQPQQPQQGKTGNWTPNGVQWQNQ